MAAGANYCFIGRIEEAETLSLESHVHRPESSANSGPKDNVPSDGLQRPQVKMTDSLSECNFSGYLHQ